MTAEAFVLADARAGHAVFLWLRPGTAAHSRLGSTTDHQGIFAESFAAVGSGTTLVQWQNFVFRFRRAAPEPGDLDRLLDQLHGADATPVEPDECCAYFAEGSERIILGPVALAKFAPRIPPSVATFHLGAIARSARYETPAGPIDRIVFEYPEPRVAQQRLSAFNALRGAVARHQGRKIGVIFDPPDRREADYLLSDLPDRQSGEAISFDLATMTDGPMTLADGVSSILFGGLIGAIIALLAALARGANGFPDRMISLGLST